MYIDDLQFNHMIKNTQSFCGNYEGIIEKKACMGNSELREIYITSNVSEIMGWAFAYLENLKQLWIPAKNIRVDKTFILDSKKCSIIVYDACLNGYNIYLDEALLLYYEFCHWYNLYDYNFAEVGSLKWYRRFDEGMKRYIASDDASLYNPFLAGGEEDYEDPMNDIECYKYFVRVEKCGVILERLMNNKHLKNEDKSFCHSYIRSNSREALEAVKACNEKAYDYLKLCIDYINIEREKMGEYISIFDSTIYAECKALLICSADTKNDKEAVWSAFDL